MLRILLLLKIVFG